MGSTCSKKRAHAPHVTKILSHNHSLSLGQSADCCSALFVFLMRLTSACPWLFCSQLHFLFAMFCFAVYFLCAFYFPSVFLQCFPQRRNVGMQKNAGRRRETRAAERQPKSACDVNWAVSNRRLCWCARTDSIRLFSCSDRWRGGKFNKQACGWGREKLCLILFRFVEQRVGCFRKIFTTLIKRCV